MKHANPLSISRRRFLAATGAVTAPLIHTAARLGAEARAADASATSGAGVKPQRRVKLGVVGCGGRGAWIARLFHRHGGYELHAVADYFQAVADACGDALGVDKQRRFSGLSGIKRVIECGVEAIVLETPPCFFPEHVRLAVDAGLHVYMAKPVAVDVPGCLAVEAAANQATAKKQVFLVDYQIPTEPPNLEVLRLIRAGEIGKVLALSSHYYAGTFADPPKTATLESRLRSLIWCNDVAVGGGYHVNACIHAIDAALWVAGQRPVSASGASLVGRSDPHGDSHDVFQLVFEYADGLIHSHRGKHLNNQTGFDVICLVQGQTGHAQVCYGGKAMLKGPENAYQVEVPNPYEAGAERNIATFHQSVVEGHGENPTVRRSIDGTLATILGREAGLRRSKLTLSDLLRENQRLEVDLSGLKS